MSAALSRRFHLCDPSLTLLSPLVEWSAELPFPGELAPGVTAPPTAGQPLSGACRLASAAVFRRDCRVACPKAAESDLHLLRDE
jgi:hypothetical protein